MIRGRSQLTGIVSGHMTLEPREHFQPAKAGSNFTLTKGYNIIMHCNLASFTAI